MRLTARDLIVGDGFRLEDSRHSTRFDVVHIANDGTDIEITFVIAGSDKECMLIVPRDFQVWLIEWVNPEYNCAQDNDHLGILELASDFDNTVEPVLWNYGTRDRS